MNRILAIEPDTTRGLRLRRLVRKHLGADVVIATSSVTAIAAMSDSQPDLILTSLLLAGDEEQALVAHLRSTPSMRHLPVLTIPAITDLSTPETRPGGLFSRLLGQRTPQTWPAYSVNAVIARIEEALEQSKLAAARAAVEIELVADEPAAAPRVETHDQEPLPVIESGLVSSRSHKRARRWSRSDLPWLSTVKVSWGQHLQLLNISSSGMLVESGLRLSPGARTTFQLGGPELALVVPARVIRCRVTEVDSLGVKYETAAVFERPIDALIAPDDDPIDAGVRLAGLVAALREHAATGASPAELRDAFETGVLDLITARDVRLRDVPVVENDGRESVDLTVPSGNGAPAVLQVTFNSNDQPSADDFAVMLAAADAAAGVLSLTGTTKQTVVRTMLLPAALTTIDDTDVWRELQIA